MSESTSSLQRTALYAAHVAAGAKLVDFAGWEMPINYGSQVEEHHIIRRSAGMFDVSHMVVSDITGSGAKAWLQHLVANDVAKLQPNQALYTCMLNPEGGVIDDLIIYERGNGNYRIVSNAATRDGDLAWFQAQAASFDVTITERPELAMIAVQGPQARDKALSVLSGDARATVEGLKRFYAAEVETDLGVVFAARTGYTGEDGFEWVVPNEVAQQWWQRFVDAGIQPCGLGARDTLRLEAGMMLYGSDMTTTTTPLESGLNWTIAWGEEGGPKRDFVGRAALEAQKAAGVPRKMFGLLLQDRGVLRSHMMVQVNGQNVGAITSGGFSPTLERSIALARVESAAGLKLGDTCQVEVRGKALNARVVKANFVREGQALVDL